MKTSKFVVAVLWIFVHVSFPGIARAQNVEWVRQFGASSGSPLSIAANETGSYVAGTVHPGVLASEEDALVRRYDAAGNQVWVRSFGTPQADSATGVAVEGAIVAVAGRVDGTLPGQTSAGSSDAFVRLYDVNGNELWTRQFGTSEPDWVKGVSVAAGSVYVVGNISPPRGPSFLRKYDASGNLLWSLEIPLGFFGSISGIAVEATAFYVAGYTYGASYDAFLRKYDLSGNELWTRGFDLPLGRPGSPSTKASAVAIDSTGVYVGGIFGPEGTPIGIPSFPPGPFRPASFVRKYDFEGNEQWTRSFRFTERDNEAATLIADATGVYVGGEFGGFSYPFVRKYDASGTEQWTFLFGQPIGGISELAAHGGSVHGVGFTVRAWPGQGSVGNSGSVVLKLGAGPFPPILSSNPVVDSASLIPTAPIAAGSIASLFGFNLSPAPDRVDVRLNGIAAPLIAVTPTQINFQVPWELAGLSEAQLTITTDAGTASATVHLSSSAPGLFSTSMTGHDQGAILISGTASFAAPRNAFPESRPARRGEVISIFCTGLGPVMNQPATGASAPLDPLATTLVTPTVRIGGEIAVVQFSGLAPGLLGIYQINVQVPPRGGGSVVVEMGGLVSNTVTIAVE